MASLDGTHAVAAWLLNSYGPVELVRLAVFYGVLAFTLSLITVEPWASARRTAQRRLSTKDERIAYLQVRDHEQRKETEDAVARYSRIMGALLLGSIVWPASLVWLTYTQAGSIIVIAYSALSLAPYLALRHRRDLAKRSAGFRRTVDDEYAALGRWAPFIFGRDGRAGASPLALWGSAAVFALAVILLFTPEGEQQVRAFAQQFRGHTSQDDDFEQSPPSTTPAPNLTEPTVPIEAQTTWNVRPNDNLWRIAEAELQRRLGRKPSIDEVGMFWLDIKRLNALNVREPGNFDLIFPDDIVLLPPESTLP